MLGEAHGRAAGVGDDVERCAVAEERAELAQRLREQRHELVVVRLAEDVGDLLGVHRAQLGVRPRPERAEAVGEAPRDREVAGDRRPSGPRRLRSVGNQPEPKLIASSART